MAHCCAGKERIIGWDEVEQYSDKWKLYKELIAGIPADVMVKHLCIGNHWCYVEAESGLGMSMVVGGGTPGFGLTQRADHMSLRDLACQATSWNFLEASAGVAALNAWYSVEKQASAAGMIIDEGENDGFRVYADLVAGKNVTIVGHFPLIERMADSCNLTILERVPGPGDTPDPACEYILDEQDYLFMTGITLTNKTMPRLLTLAREGGCETILVGPSVVPSTTFFDYGVMSMAGAICLPDKEKMVKMAIEQCGTSKIFSQGVQKMRVEKPGWQK